MPAEYTPPIGQNMLMHLYEHPEHAGGLPDCFGKVPKKLRHKLMACPNRGSSKGWGLCFSEGLSWLKLLLCCFFGIALSAAFGIVWSVVRSDVEGGFGVSCFMLASFAFVVTLVQSVADR